MTVVLVVHGTNLPAVDGMVAGMVAAERQAELVPLVTGGAGLGRYDCVLHVLAHGELIANGLFWAEWASGRFVGPPVQAAAVASHPAPVVVVSANPSIPAQTKAAERITYHAERLGRPLERLEVAEEGDAFVVRDRAGKVRSRWIRDAFGRPQPAGEERRRHSRRVAILIVGEPDLLRDTYPANLAALGDAADAAGLDVALSFWDPREGPLAAGGARLQDIDGIVLPGGSDMEQVAGQIDLAQRAIRHDVPTVGLCLGMQTMATAMAREVGGYNDANMAEADPDAEIKTFVRLNDEDGRPQFRLGVRRVRLATGSRLAAIFGGAEAHRGSLQPPLRARPAVPLAPVRRRAQDQRAAGRARPGRRDRGAGAALLRRHARAPGADDQAGRPASADARLPARGGPHMSLSRHEGQPVCLIVQPIHAAGLELLTAAGIRPLALPDSNAATVLAAVGEADAVITRNNGLSAESIAAAPRLRVIAVHGVGTDAVATEVATERGVVVVNTPHVNAQSVAEHVLALTFALAKAIVPADTATRNGDLAFKYRVR